MIKMSEVGKGGVEIVRIPKRKVRRALAVFDERISGETKKSSRAKTIPMYPLD